MAEKSNPQKRLNNLLEVTPLTCGDLKLGLVTDLMLSVIVPWHKKGLKSRAFSEATHRLRVLPSPTVFGIWVTTGPVPGCGVWESRAGLKLSSPWLINASL